MLSRYDIVLVAFPFTDGPAAKPRPALVITTSDRHGDVLLAFISSNISGPTASDELDIPAEYPGFSGTGLKVSSRLRLSRMTTLALPLVKRRIGQLPLALQTTCQQVLQRVIGGQG
ncbi:type II toxin-antitoxin system PemK/MazF family toxin [Synechococcus sp. CBW1108]|jgi:mRNA interferase MazF|uniref:type II toxin-antitoxin system PemK/MazF family toxin n=1 Tax=Synechococcus sp. CBW1108 TaxID=1353147 RepID=UPI0018CEFA11|nr:type II toxin-antitoxin system PemK/MazF family toxin [Synechococcus sp. CBW1108]NQW38837.1 type II toxin-antitoxin system PemK/MazF family toxin [Cyanobacteria bacterium bin.275]QPN69975.1 type II toxin-antitoxin system PemK/MazF family toxin [Synechococcus sp. CBW1108]